MRTPRRTGARHQPSSSESSATIFFVADDGTSGNELWKTDGTAAGTVRVKDINPGAAASNPTQLMDFGGTLLFRRPRRLGRQ